jgi:serine/threonine-protein kinase RIO1
MLLEQALLTVEIMFSRHVLRVIDMPQAVDARTIPNARLLPGRDVANVCRYFASQAPTQSLAPSPATRRRQPCRGLQTIGPDPLQVSTQCPTTFSATSLAQPPPPP